MQRELIAEIIVFFTIIVVAVLVVWRYQNIESENQDRLVELLHSAKASSDEFTPGDCAKLCAPLPVISFLPGYCRIQNDSYYLQRCDSSVGATNATHISAVCACGQQTK